MRTYEQKFYLAMETINKIDDYLEYRYKEVNKQYVRDTIVDYLDQFAREIADDETQNQK